MKKWMMIAMVTAGLGLASGLSACAAMDEALMKKESTTHAEGKKSCSTKDKQACDWKDCDKADCELHAAVWDAYSVSDFYDI